MIEEFVKLGWLRKRVNLSIWLIRICLIKRSHHLIAEHLNVEMSNLIYSEELNKIQE